MLPPWTPAQVTWVAATQKGQAGAVSDSSRQGQNLNLCSVIHPHPGRAPRPTAVPAALSPLPFAFVCVPRQTQESAEDGAAVAVLCCVSCRPSGPSCPRMADTSLQPASKHGREGPAQARTLAQRSLRRVWTAAVCSACQPRGNGGDLGHLDSHMQKNEVGPTPHTIQEVDAKWIKDKNMTPETMTPRRKHMSISSRPWS